MNSSKFLKSFDCFYSINNVLNNKGNAGNVRPLYNNNRIHNELALITPWSSRMYYTLTHVADNSILTNVRNTSTESKETDTKSTTQLTRKEQLKRAVKEYGSTVIVFHVTISLMSLGVCYVLVSSGIDVATVLTSLGISGSVATNAGTFVTAYAIHKVFAPIRISITLGATPFIVRYLRRIGFLKVPKGQ